MNDSAKKSYFNLQTTGIGYVNRVRNVTPKKGDPFLSCEIAALVGESGSAEKRYFDVKVVGDEAKHLIQRYKAASDANRKVMIGFVIGDLWVNPYTITKGAKVGQKGFQLKGRLLFITWVSLDGKRVYTAEAKAPVDTQGSNDVTFAEPRSLSDSESGVSEIDSSSIEGSSENSAANAEAIAA